jgi:hypothetical protein
VTVVEMPNVKDKKYSLMHLKISQKHGFFNISRKKIIMSISPHMQFI